MSEPKEATDTVPTPQKRKPGRPKKTPESSGEIAQLRRLVMEMQDREIKRGAEQSDKQLASLAPIPAPTEELKPGSYIEQGRDASGAPILGKVSWTREWIERTYIPVTFTPNRSMDINPHGVRYHVDADVEATVPKIVKDIYDATIKSERDMLAATKPLSAQEVSDIDARANEQPGSKQYSRLYRLAGGLNVSQQESAEPEPAK